MKIYIVLLLLLLVSCSTLDNTDDIHSVPTVPDYIYAIQQIGAQHVFTGGI